MGKKSGSAPKAPNPYKVADAQTQQNLAAARTNAQLNRINTYTPYGSDTYQNLGNDQWQRNISLSPDAQAALTAQQKLSANLGNQLAGRDYSQFGSQMDLSNLQGLYNPAFKSDLPTDMSADRQKVEDALYSRYRSRLDPQYQQMESGLENNLSNKGIFEGSEAYQKARQNFLTERNDAYDQARTSAVIGGGQEESRLLNELRQNMGFGNELQQQQFANSLGGRQQQLQELMGQRQLPFQELTGLYGLLNGNQAPQFGNTPGVNVNPADIQGAFNQQYQGQLNAFNNQQQTNSANTGAAAGLIGTGIMAVAF